MTLHAEAGTRPRGTPAAGPQPVRPGSIRNRLSRLDIKGSPYLYVAPFFILFAVFGVYPMLYTLWISLHNWPLLSAGQSHAFLGLGNFRELYHDSQFWNSVENTFGIFVLSTLPQLLMALFLANLLNKRIRSRTFFRMGVIVPIITSTAVVGIVFNELYSRDFGLFNWLLHGIGIGPIDWKADRWSSWSAIATMVNWRWTGYNALIYLAAMQSIPRDVYESASLDGASASKQFWRITVPMLRPTIIFTVIISTIGGLQLFGEPVTFTTGSGGYRGGATRPYQTMTMYLFEQMFERGRLGYAATVAWVLVMIILITSILNFLIVRRINSDR
ncbi:MAG TPA: sugar ABC transporter permease [Rugosimonospora sp.]|nr:sugar ABC transporter permease [Rugosimonospora sp.]